MFYVGIGECDHGKYPARLATLNVAIPGSKSDFDDAEWIAIKSSIGKIDTLFYSYRTWDYHSH